VPWGIVAQCEWICWPTSTTTRSCAFLIWQEVTTDCNISHELLLAIIFLEHVRLHNFDYWTSGSQKDCPGKLSWCSLERPVRSRNLSWAYSHGGDCVSVKYGPNAISSTFTNTSCDKELQYICEVHSEILALFSVYCEIVFPGAQQWLLFRRLSSRVHGSVERLY
jgi:hypothetical protein